MYRKSVSRSKSGTENSHTILTIKEIYIASSGKYLVCLRTSTAPGPTFSSSQWTVLYCGRN